MCSSRNFMVSGLTFKSLIHFELFFLQSVNSGPVQFFCTQHQFSQYLFIEETVVFHCIFLPPFSQITWSYICGFISGLFVVSLIYVPVLLCVCVCVCVCANTYCFDYYSLQCISSLKSGSIMPPALFFFLKIASVIQNLLWFHTNFSMYCSISVKNAIEQGLH